MKVNKMKKITKKQRERDVRRVLKQRLNFKRKNKKFRNNDSFVKHKRDVQWKELNAWINSEKKNGLSVKDCKTKRQKINLIFFRMTIIF